ncbi:nucleotide-binding domain-containing protein [Mycolicibacterium vulneris]|uniref:nucleotide-binding domain-containing protein n=1 Tax=Mycolicibacterium vulneris TaxID=547163 RepID=UPI000DA110B8|nr:hypothetical protein [Mycolicibacterium vulneris]
MYGQRQWDVPQRYKDKWKVLNRGDVAGKPSAIRGQLINEDSQTHGESTRLGSAAVASVVLHWFAKCRVCHGAKYS